MAQKVIVSLVDDLTGGEAHETVRFGLDGVDYEIDLASKSADKLRKQLAPFVGGARRTKRDGRKPAPAQRSGPKASDVRTWAKANGHAVPDRGRIPGPVMDAYKEVHG